MSTSAVTPPSCIDNSVLPGKVPSLALWVWLF